MILTATIEGRCVPWQRTASYQGRKLTPAKQRAYQRLVQMTVRNERPAGWPLDARYAVELAVYAHPMQRGDLDNVCKTLLDALNGTIWADDRQVDVLAIVRRVERERPRVEVSVAALTVAERDAAKIDITIGNTPCSPDGGPANLEVPSRPLARQRQRPRGVGAPGAETEPERTAR